MKDREELIRGTPNSQQTAMAPVSMELECLQPRNVEQRMVRGMGVGNRVGVGESMPLAEGGRALRVRSPDEVGLGAGVGVFEIDL
jgi:hypothetical protein